MARCLYLPIFSSKDQGCLSGRGVACLGQGVPRGFRLTKRADERPTQQSKRTGRAQDGRRHLLARLMARNLKNKGASWQSPPEATIATARSNLKKRGGDFRRDLSLLLALITRII